MVRNRGFVRPSGKELGETGVKVDSASRVNIWIRKCTACWTEQSGLVVVKSQFCEESSQWYCVKELVL